MKLSTKIRYGLRAMIDLALNTNGKPIFTQSIAERQHTSRKYLENLLTSLKSAGLVKSVRGMRGGYILARSPEEITVTDVFEALDGQLEVADCVNSEARCLFEENCPTHELWVKLTETIKSLLTETTVAELAKNAIEKQREGAEMYYI